MQQQNPNYYNIQPWYLQQHPKNYST